MPESPLTGDWSRIPEHQQEALKRWCELHDTYFEITRYFDGGFSGAPVALAIWRDHDGLERQIFLRFHSIDELKRIKQAGQDAKLTSSGAYLPEVQLIYCGDFGVAMTEPAGGDLLAYRPLGEVMWSGDHPIGVDGIVNSLVHEWNQPPPSVQRRSITVCDYLTELLTGRPEPRTSPGKRLRSWAEEHDISSDQARVASGWWSSELCNPLAFLGGAAPRSREVVALRIGRTHGDLNIGNILIAVSDPRPHQLIDLGGYHDDGPLTRDPMHLLLSIVAERLRKSIRLGRETGRDLIRVLVRADPTADNQSDLRGLAEISKAVHDAGREVARKSGFGGEWRQQTLLSLAGCALLFADRDLRMSDEEQAREWFFTLAAAALDEYLKITPEQVAPVVAQAASGEGAAARVSKPVGAGGEEIKIAHDACKAIVHHLSTQARSRQGLTADQAYLLLRDFGARASFLTKGDYGPLAVQAVEAFFPPDAFRTGDATPEIGEPVRPAERGVLGSPTRSGETEPQPHTQPAADAAVVVQRADVAILTSHPAEYRAVLRVLLPTTVVVPQPPGVGHWLKLQARRARRSLRVYLTCARERLGPDQASVVDDVVRQCDPAMFLLVGTARGESGGRLGDVAVPYWFGQYTLLDSGETVTQLPRLWLPRDMQMMLNYYARSKTHFRELAAEFRKSSPAHELPDRPYETPDLIPNSPVPSGVACGSAEFLDRVSLEEMRARIRYLAALDTESYEFGRRNRKRRHAVFRGVVPDEVARSGSTPELFLAAGHAAACMKDFLEYEYLPELADISD